MPKMSSITKTTSRRLYLLLIVILYAGLSALFAYLVAQNAKEILKLFKHITWDYAFASILLHIPIIALGGLSFHIIATRFNIHQHFRDWFGISFIANFMNHLLPYRPGVLFRYIYLRKHYHMKTADYVYVTITCLGFILLISALFMLWGWFFGSQISEFYIFPILNIGILFIIIVAIYWIKKAQKRDTSQINNVMKNWFKNFNFILSHPFSLFFSLGTIFLLNFFTALVFYILFFALKAPIDFSYAIFMAGVISLALLFPITPGNIGVLETLAGILTLNAYNDFSLGFSVVALYRFTQWVPSLLLGMGFSFLLMGRFLPSSADFGGKNQTQLNLEGE